MRKDIDKKFIPRHLARRATLMAMYAHQLSGENDPQKLLQIVVSYDELPEQSLGFLNELLIAALKWEKFSDSIIEQVAENWEIGRISAIDRNILRIGIAEFLDFPLISHKITIDEAVELAKEFGSAQSSKFVNGVLDAALKKLMQMNKINLQQ